MIRTVAVAPPTSFEFTDISTVRDDYRESGSSISGDSDVATSESSEMFMSALATMRASVGRQPDDKSISDGAELMSQCSVHAALGQYTQLRHILQRGGDPNELDLDGDRRPLHWAAARAHSKCVELLLSYGADLTSGDAAGTTPIELAERFGHDRVAFLLRHGEAIDDPKRVNEGMRPGLSLQAALGHHDQLKHMLHRFSACLDEIDDDGDRTALHWAAARGHVRVAQLLIKAGADLHVRDAAGRTPVELALTLRQADTYHLLLGVEEESRLRAVRNDGPSGFTSLQQSRMTLQGLMPSRRPQSARF